MENSRSIALRTQSIILLHRHLAAAIDLHEQLKESHWNVCGPGFLSIHKLFDTVANKVETSSQMIVERVIALGGTAHGTFPNSNGRFFLLLGIADESSHVFAMSAALAAFSQSAREAIDLATSYGDPDTADLFSKIGRGIDQQLWIVESHAVAQIVEQERRTNARNRYFGGGSEFSRVVAFGTHPMVARRTGAENSRVETDDQREQRKSP